MRIIFLNKKLVEAQPAARHYPLKAYHGTNLLALYRILTSGQLGSSAGRHGGVYERIGAFYITTDISEAQSYAAETSYHDEWFYLPYEEVSWIDLSDADTTTLDGIAQALGLDKNDLGGIYQTMASLMRYYFGGGDYPPVVIYIVIWNPEIKEKFYVDEDKFRDWLEAQPAGKEVEEGFTGKVWGIGKIVEVASRESSFRDWLSEQGFLAEQIESVGDLEEVAKREAADQYWESHPADEDLNPDMVPQDAFHLVAKQIYLALLELAEKGDNEAKEILRAAGENATSFYVAEPLSLNEADFRGAVIYLPNRTKKIISLRDREEALREIEAIMVNQIVEWAQELKRLMARYKKWEWAEGDEKIYLNKLAKALSELRRALEEIKGAAEV